MLIPLVLEGTSLREDRTRAPLLVPLGLLGCKVEASLQSAGGAYHGDTYALGQSIPTCGGAPLQTLHLDATMFASDVMKAGGELDFEAMKLPQLKEELAARGSTRSGLKATLQRRLHGLLVQAAIAQRTEEAQRDGAQVPAGHRAAKVARRTR